ncbi:MAG: hypothetical protein ACR2OR_06055 [Hyphomicrobiales bacterium]
MSKARQLTPLRNEDYEAIEAAVMETARGRWFLKEYAHRNRTADTNMLLNAIGRIEDALALKTINPEIDAAYSEVGSDRVFEPALLAQVITDARVEISSIRDGLLEEEDPLQAGSDPLEATVISADTISASIFEQARGLQETVYKLRDAGAHELLSDALDECAENLMRISQKQDLNARRIAEALRALQHLDRKLTGGLHFDAANEELDVSVPPTSENYAAFELAEESADDHIVFIQTKGSGAPPPFMEEASEFDHHHDEHLNEPEPQPEPQGMKPLVYLPR